MYTTLQKITLKSESIADFLQAIITQDINHCKKKPSLSLLCTPYGKVVHIFWVHLDINATIYIDNTLSDHFIKTIEYYDPFSNIQIEKNNQPVAIDELYKSIHEPWPLFLIKNSIIRLDENTQKRYIPQVLNLNNAISFRKGCFIGHEPISRTQFKGRIKRKLTYLISEEKPKDALNFYYQAPYYHCLLIQPLHAESETK
jgi:folate-binding protein YgfZ